METDLFIALGIAAIAGIAFLIFFKFRTEKNVSVRIVTRLTDRRSHGVAAAELVC